jgi:hypothetical protein
MAKTLCSRIDRGNHDRVFTGDCKRICLAIGSRSPGESSKDASSIAEPGRTQRNNMRSSSTRETRFFPDWQSCSSQHFALTVEPSRRHTQIKHRKPADEIDRGFILGIEFDVSRLRAT